MTSQEVAAEGKSSAELIPKPWKSNETAQEDLPGSNLVYNPERPRLVEGEHDRIALEAILRDRSPQLRRALDTGSMVLDCLFGGSNLTYKASLIVNAICSVHCFLDDDRCGRNAFERATADGILTATDANFATCRGKTEAEIEDLYEPALYADMLEGDYGVRLLPRTFRTSEKWSDRVRETFKSQGKMWNDRVESEVTLRIAHLVARTPTAALNAAHQKVLDSLIKSVEGRLAVA